MGKTGVGGLKWLKLPALIMKREAWPQPRRLLTAAEGAGNTRGACAAASCAAAAHGDSGWPDRKCAMRSAMTLRQQLLLRLLLTARRGGLTESARCAPP